MLKPLFCFLLLLFSLASLAQRKYSRDKVSGFFISLVANPTEAPKQFSQVTFIDKRFDTTKAGFAYDGSKHKILQINGGLVNSLQQYVEKKFTVNDPSLPKLLIVLRNLWMHELKAGELKEGEDGSEKQNISRCIAKMEVYVKKDDFYQALIRIDTTIEDDAYLKYSGGRLLADLLDQGMKKISALNISDVTSKKTKMTLTDLMVLYNRRMAVPRLASDTIQRGIYLTFADFLQRRPMLDNFVLEQDEGGDYLYLGGNGEQRLFTDFWGFCDGKSQFIKLGSNFFPLVRDNNSYSFFGCLQPIHNSKPRSRNRLARYALFGVFGELHNSRLVNYLRPMQIDMETGKPF